MANNLSLEQYKSISQNLEVDENGVTNKKCPLCGGAVVIKNQSNSYTLSCAGDNCFHITCRGV